MGLESLIIKLLEKHAARAAAVVTTGTAIDIDLQNYTCTVERVDRPELFKVRLNATEFQGNRFVVVPKDNSNVLVCNIEGDEAEGYVLACSEVDIVLVAIDDTQFKLTNAGTHIGKDGDSLKDILDEIVQQMLKIYAPKDVSGITALTQRIDNVLV